MDEGTTDNLGRRRDDETLATNYSHMDTQTEQAPPKRRLKKLIVLVLFLLFLGGSAGGGIYFWKFRTSAAAGDELAAEGDAKPEESEAEVKGIVDLPPFIVNLADNESARYLRMTVSLGVAGNEKSEKPDPVFSTKARNAILAVISSKRSEEILTAEGKDALRKEILTAAQSVSKEPHVAEIYITEFIVQL
jgi:flagellar FliL protein